MFKPPVKVRNGWDVYNQIAGGDDMTGDGIGNLVGRTVDGALYIYPGTALATSVTVLISAGPPAGRLRVGRLHELHRPRGSDG